MFWAKGYEGTSIAILTAAMGINPPSLAAFGNKETLFRKARDRYEARRGEIFDEAFTAPRAVAIERLLTGMAERLTDKLPDGAGSASGRRGV